MFTVSCLFVNVNIIGKKCLKPVIGFGCDQIIRSMSNDSRSEFSEKGINMINRFRKSDVIKKAISTKK